MLSRCFCYPNLTISSSQAFTFVREFVLGNNKAGTVVKTTTGGVSVVGGEDPALAADIIEGRPEIYYGAGATQSTYVFPSATRAAWKAFRAQETASANHANFSQDNLGFKVTPLMGNLVFL